MTFNTFLLLAICYLLYRILGALRVLLINSVSIKLHTREAKEQHWEMLKGIQQALITLVNADHRISAEEKKDLTTYGWHYNRMWRAYATFGSHERNWPDYSGSKENEIRDDARRVISLTGNAGRLWPFYRTKW